MNHLATFTVESATALVVAVTALIGALATAVAQMIQTLRGTHSTALVAKAQSDNNTIAIANLNRVVAQVAAASPPVAAAARDVAVAVTEMAGDGALHGLVASPPRDVPKGINPL